MSLGQIGHARGAKDEVARRSGHRQHMAKTHVVPRQELHIHLAHGNPGAGHDEFPQARGEREQQRPRGLELRLAPDIVPRK